MTQQLPRWTVSIPVAGVFQIGSRQVDFQSGLGFVDVSTSDQSSILGGDFLSRLAQLCQTQPHYQVFRGLRVTAPEGQVLTDHKFELGVVIGFTLADDIVGFLYVIDEGQPVLLGLWPEPLAAQFHEDNATFRGTLDQLNREPQKFKGVSLFFPEFYPY